MLKTFENNMSSKLFRGMFISAVCLVLLIAWSCRNRNHAVTSPIVWQEYGAGLAEASATGKRVMLYFWRPGCGWCKKMESKTFIDKEVANTIAKYFVPIKIDGWSDEIILTADGKSSGRSLAAEYQVTGYPRIWFLESDGQPINYYPGYASIEDFKVVLGYVGEGHYKNKTLKEYAGSIGRVF